MAHKLKVGDHVSWNSEAGRVRGTIKKKVTSPIKFKNYTVRASKEEPQYLIKSDLTDHMAMHKGTALKKNSLRVPRFPKTIKTPEAEMMEDQRNCVEDITAADTLITYEQETWSLIKRRDVDGFARYLADDFYDIFPDGQER
ncbi:MAG TPA: DUF2945 domain-containing protein, partial [Nitrospiraceae bacterium]|nr:DUF2945 domain-containing protein [Nitrospiraceae bacterium]